MSTGLMNNASTLQLPTIPKFVFHPNGFELAPDEETPAIGEYSGAGIVLATFAAQVGLRARAAQFAIGDWLNLGFQFFGESFSQYVDELTELLRCELSTLQTYLYVARAIPTEYRCTELDWSHFKEIAYRIKDQDDREAWIDRAVNEQMSVRELRDAIKEELADDTEPKIVIVICPKCNKRFPIDEAEKVK